MFASRLPSAGIIDELSSLSSDLTTLLLVVLGTVVIFFIVKTVWASGGAVGAVVVAVLTGAFILWAANNLDTIQGWFNDEFTSTAYGVRAPDSGTMAVDATTTTTSTDLG